MLRDAWRLAVGTLTALPVAPPSVVDARRAGAAMVLAPMAVAPLGVLAAVVALLGHLLGLAPLVTALLAVGSVVLGDRAFHLDGLADTADGLAASYDRERSLAVMRTGDVGPAGVTALVLVLGLQVAGLASVLDRPHAVRAAVLAGVLVAAARAVLVLGCARGVPSARADGLGAVVVGAVPVRRAAGVLVVTAVLLAVVAGWGGPDWWRGPLALAVAVVVTALVLRRATTRVGGVTGDVLGATVELAAAALLVVCGA